MADIIWLEPSQIAFPSVDLALKDPNGLLAAGGALTSQWLLSAYQLGIFPWFEDGQPILWWSPDPRLVLRPNEVRVSKSMRKVIRKTAFEVTFDTVFEDVINACSQPRNTDAGDLSGTWITSDMKQAYCALHREGFAHSVEVWDGTRLVGGLYGVALNGVFFGESMFTRASNASKLGFITLCRHLDHWGFDLIDCQVETEHLQSLGAYNVPRAEFCQTLAMKARSADPMMSQSSRWKVDTHLLTTT
ncbi:leucyl/phenylalanyl-tRNA--protein transferase [Aurantivibrio plasticivorans]